MKFLWVKTLQRQEHIIRNLALEHDIVEEEKEDDLKEVAVTQVEEKIEAAN